MERKETSTFWRLRYCSEAPVLAASMRAGGARTRGRRCFHARRRRAHPGQALLPCAPEARAPGAGAADMRAEGARTRGRRC